MYKNVTIFSWQCHINVAHLTFIRAVFAFPIGKVKKHVAPCYRRVHESS